MSRRGQVTILDRARLEGAACECYHVVANTGARLFGEWSPTRRRAGPT